MTDQPKRRRDLTTAITQAVSAWVALGAKVRIDMEAGTIEVSKGADAGPVDPFAAVDFGR